MNMFWAILLLAGGLLILWKAADALVSGAVGLANFFGISPLIVGLTVVAMGTSAPEVAASIAAAMCGAGDIAIGNVYGSNIANLALVGGVCALIRPITIQKRILKYEMPVMLAVTLLLWPILYNLDLSRTEGIILLMVFVSLIVLTMYTVKKGLLARPALSFEKKENHLSRPLKICIIFVAIGLIGLAIGADITVRGAVFIGTKMGMSQAIIGLTIIAVGTSLPELVTCVVAAVKGHDDISIGNLVGSNIFNILLVTGAAGTIRPFGLQQQSLSGSDYWIMVIISGLFIGMAYIGRKISRIEGLILAGTYAGAISYFIYCM